MQEFELRVFEMGLRPDIRAQIAEGEHQSPQGYSNDDAIGIALDTYGPWADGHADIFEVCIATADEDFYTEGDDLIKKGQLFCNLFSHWSIEGDEVQCYTMSTTWDSVPLSWLNSSSTTFVARTYPQEA